MNGSVSDIQQPLASLVGERISFWQKNKKLISGFLAGLLILALIGISLWVYFQVPQAPQVPAQFTLKASISDAAGIDPVTTFVLQSSQPLNKGAIKKIIIFEPVIDFTIKSLTKAPSFWAFLFAQAKETATKTNLYEIRPAQKLAEGKIYQVMISDPDYADREYSWAFQTKASFQVIATHPRNKGNGAPLNTGIEITFNRENLIDAQNHFSILPQVEGTFEQHSDTLIFLPKNLEPTTVYTVTIKKGLKSQGSDEALAEDYVFVFETQDKPYGSYSYFNFRKDFVEFIPSKKPVLQVDYYKVDVNNIEMSVYKLKDADEFIDSYQNSRQWDLGWTNYYTRRFESYYNANPSQNVLTFKPSIIEEGYQKFIELPEVLEPGYYILDAFVDGQHKKAWLQISPLSHYFSVTHQKGLLWMYDFEKKEPIADSKVLFIDQTVEGSNLGNTNSEGLAEFSTPDALKEENENASSNPKFFKVEKDGYLPLVIKVSSDWYYWSSRDKVGQGDIYWDYLSTDRYTYQISDTIRYWGVVKGRQQDLKQRKVKVGIYSGYYGSYGYGGYSLDQDQSLVSQEVLISQFDTIQGQLSFKGLDPGYYNVRVTLGNEVVSRSSVRVLSYSKPVYQIKATPLRDSIFAGDKIKFQIEANFFDDTPVAGLKLKYNYYWQGQINGEITLDENGRGAVSFTPQYYEDRYAYWPRQLYVNFLPVLSEEGEISASARVLVFGPNIYLQASRENSSDDHYKFTAKLNHIVIDDLGTSDDDYYWTKEYIGDPVQSYNISAKIIKTTYTKEETGQYYDPINKIVKKRYRYVKNEETTDQLSGTTNQAGEWSFEKTIPDEEGAAFRVVFSGQDSQGRKIERTVYVYRKYYYSGSDWKDFFVTLKIKNTSSNKETDDSTNQFSIGDRINLELKIVEGEKPAKAKILFYRFQNNIEMTTIGSDYIFEETFEKEFIPNVQYRAVILGPYGFEESSASALFKKEDNQLTIDINPDKDKYRPGQEVKIDLLVKDKDEKTVSAEVNVAVVDEALFHILPYNWQSKILDSFYMPVYTSPIIGKSQYVILAEAASGIGGCFGAGTQILMSDGSSKPIEKIKVGDQILTLVDENSQELRPAVVQGISQHLVDGYLIINGSLKVTAEHKMYVNNQWTEAGRIQIGDILTGTDSSFEVTSVEYVKAENTLVYNIVVGQYHTYFANGYFVHNQEKGIERENFVDVALYQTVQTGNDGQASVSFTAPDNITAWRTTAIAYSSKDLKVGQDIKLIKTSLPFFVDTTLSKYYLIDDNPDLRLRAFGTDYDQSQSTDFTIKSDSLALDKKISSTDSTVYLPLGQLPVGEHKITVSAKQGSFEDAVIRNIEVVKSYFRKSESSIYDLSSSLSAIKANIGGFTKLVFMDGGQGRFYRALRRHSYLSGIRADQLTANYFGEKLLAQYFDEPEPNELLDLKDYHTDQGGISLFTYSDNDLELSAKMADLALDFVYRTRLRNYFINSLKDEKADIHRIAKALYGLASLKEPVLVKLNLVKNSEELNLEDKTYISLGLAKLGDKENARQIYQNEIKNQLRFQGGEAWLEQEPDITKRVKLTATIAILASYLNFEEDIDALWKYISTHNPKRDLDVLEEALVAKSELAKTKDKEVKFSYRTKDRNDTVSLEKGRSYSLTLSADELKTIKFTNIEGKIDLVSFYERSKTPQELIKNNELSLTRKYLVNGQITNSFKEGDIVMVRLDPDIAASAIDGSYQIIDYLPSGLRPITRTYRQGLKLGTICDAVWYPTRIIDNVVYFRISKGFSRSTNCGNRTINYYARVVSRGSYAANPAIIQSLKDLESLNLSSKDNIEIK